jgi:transmembrane sensor
VELLKELSALFPLESPPLRLRRRWPIRWQPAATVLLALVVSVSAWLVISAVKARTFDAAYQTPIGKQLSVDLPDHSRLILNTGTSVKVHFDRHRRTVSLLRGEAHFVVAKHEPRVFSVQAGSTEFRAVGTAFDVRLGGEDGTALTVTEGQVLVLISSPAVEAARTPSPGAGNNAANVPQPKAPWTEIMVDAGKMVAIGSATQTVTRLSPAQLQAATAWQSGMLVFDARPLEEVIQEINRYTPVRFRFEQDQIRKIPVSGYFKLGDVDALIASLQSNFDLRVRRENDLLILSGPSP